MSNNKKTILISSVQLILMSIGFLSIALLISISIPNLLNSVIYNTLSIFTTIRSWFQPPYLYFITNAIIITIVASSRLHHNHHNNRHDEVSPPQLPPSHHYQQQPYHNNDVISIRAHRFPPHGVVSVKDVVYDDNDIVIKEIIRDDTKSTVIERSTWTPPPKYPPLKRQDISEKVSLRFDQWPTKAYQAEDGKGLRLSKPTKHDTLENIWKAITQGHNTSQTHLNSPDTCQQQDRQIDLLNDSSAFSTAEMKSDTFNHRTNYVPPRGTSTKLRNETSLSQDELNRRVEAFINKFNEEVRLKG